MPDLGLTWSKPLQIEILHYREHLCSATRSTMGCLEQRICWLPTACSRIWLMHGLGSKTRGIYQLVILVFPLLHYFLF